MIPPANALLPTAVDGLIPHGQGIRMVDRLIDVGDVESTGEFTVPTDSPWLDGGGRLEEAAFIEMIAQTFAAVHGYHLTPAERAAHRGLLIGVKDLIIHAPAQRGDRLTILVRRIAKFGDFGVVEGEIRRDQTLLASGEIKVWRPGEESAKESGLF
jgi:predicted hotdog family 3-hydroxylacyl-ACP dehydratase